MWKWDFPNIGKSIHFGQINICGICSNHVSFLNQGALWRRFPLELHFRNGGPSISGMNHTALEDKLGYRFNNPDLLVQALTHPSTDSKPETRRAYERLNSWETPFCSWPSHSTFTTTCPNPRKGN